MKQEFDLRDDETEHPVPLAQAAVDVLRDVRVLELRKADLPGPSVPCDASEPERHRLHTGPFDSQIAVNYNASYRNNYNNPTGLARERIGSFTTVDLHLAYTLPLQGILRDTQLTLDGSNLFDRDPPLSRQDLGYGIGESLGRVVKFGFRKKF